MPVKAISHCVGQKLSKVQWLPSEFNAQHRFLATGSWNETVNKLKIWAFSLNPEEYADPVLLAKTNVPGSVTDIQCFSREYIVASTDQGSLHLYKLSQDEDVFSLSLVQSWKGLHSYPLGPCPCTGVSVLPTKTDAVTVGEDGRVNYIDLEKSEPTRTIDSADSVTITDVYGLERDVYTVNSHGALCIWDRRSQESAPALKIKPGAANGHHNSVAVHPTQPSYVATGGGSGDGQGLLSLYDIRQPAGPLESWAAGPAPVLEVVFDAQQPTLVYSCGESGDVVVWDFNPERLQSRPSFFDPSADSIAASVLASHKLPVNSVSVSYGTLACATDGDAVLFLPDLHSL
eukprot:Colp12_sorted_trinity150504_noHs@29414